MEHNMAKKNNKKEKNLENVLKCSVCSVEANTVCTNCNKVYYCCKDHQKQDWKEHKELCRPIEVLKNDILGRYLVASRDIKKGEIILKESPLVIGPTNSSFPVCLKCYKPISPSKKQTFCLKCGVAPLCNLTCNATGHSSKECEKFKLNPKITPEKIIRYNQIILPFRCLLLRESFPEKWEEFVKLEGHVTQRKGSPIWKDHEINVVEIINQFGVLMEKDIQEQLIQQICSILDVNTFEVRVPDMELFSIGGVVRGLYLQAALMAHDCIGNTHLAVDENFNMIVHASVEIKKGETIFFNYTNGLFGTIDRQEHLREGKYFKCTCKRCLDPTECDTFMSSLTCTRCKKGLVSPNKIVGDIHKKETLWKCSEENCVYKCRGDMVESAVNCAKSLIDDADKTDIRIVENLMKKLLYTFCPTHSLIIDLKQNLIGLYTELLRREVNPNRKYLHRKLELCQELIPILEKVEPGISRLTGITLYEAHIPMVIIANREYDNGEIPAEELLKKMLRAEEMLKKAISYLLYEPSASPEGRLATNALGELKLLRKSVSNVEQIVEKKNLNLDKRRKKNRK